tara:strand:+ start:1270 stop:1551 length:282 start_codon:yes stop_codon:yes gene_type:complete
MKIKKKNNNLLIILFLILLNIIFLLLGNNSIYETLEATDTKKKPIGFEIKKDIKVQSVDASLNTVASDPNTSDKMVNNKEAVDNKNSIKKSIE